MIEIGDVFVGRLSRYYRKFTTPILSLDEDNPVMNDVDNQNEDCIGSYKIIIRDMKGDRIWYESFQTWPDGSVTNINRPYGETKETELSKIESEIVNGHLVKECVVN